MAEDSSRRGPGSAGWDPAGVDDRTLAEKILAELVAAFYDAGANVKPQVSAQILAWSRRLSELPDGKKVSKADELAARRRERATSDEVALPD